MSVRLLAADADSWLLTSWSAAGWVVASGAAMLLAVVAIIRVVGLRSLSKMSSSDFAVTVAIGSILGSVVASPTSIADSTRTGHRPTRDLPDR